MIDHMLFNLKKWFAFDSNNTKMIVNGQTWYKCPKSFELTGGNEPEYPVLGIGIGSVYGYSKDKPTMFYKNDSGETAEMPFDDSRVKNVKWGGKSLPIRLYQRLRSLFYPRREVA